MARPSPGLLHSGGSLVGGFAPLPCCALALAGLRRIGCRAVAQTGVAANPIVRTLPDGRQVLFGLARGDFTTRTATAPKDGQSPFAVMPQRDRKRTRLNTSQ